MASKDYGVSLLLDFYAELLSASQRECLDLYYNEDLSLSEISENLGMSRQGALNNIKKGESILHDFEDKLCLTKRFTESQSALKELCEMLDELSNGYPQCKAQLDRIKAKIVNLLS